MIGPNSYQDLQPPEPDEEDEWDEVMHRETWERDE